MSFLDELFNNHKHEDGDKRLIEKLVDLAQNLSSVVSKQDEMLSHKDKIIMELSRQLEECRHPKPKPDGVKFDVTFLPIK